MLSQRVNEYLQEARGIGEKDMQLLDELIDETVDVCNAQIDEAATRILREMGVNADGTRAMCYDEWKSNFNASHAVGNVRADAKKMVVEYQMENKEENGADGGVECISNRTVVKGSSESNEADDVKDLD